MTKELEKVLEKVQNLKKETELWLTQETYLKLREEACDLLLNDAQCLELIFDKNVIEISLRKGTLYGEISGKEFETSLQITLILDEQGEVFGEARGTISNSKVPYKVL